MYCTTLVTVGDEISKKTELLAKYTGRDISHRYITNLSVLDDVIVDHRKHLVHFIDTECSDDYKILRRNAVEKADCVLLCYSVIHRSSFENLSRKWCLEVRECFLEVPIILVGTEIEKRKNGVHDISTEEGENFKKLIGAFSFVECSIETFVGVDDVFIEAIRSVTSRYCFLKPLIKMK